MRFLPRDEKFFHLFLSQVQLISQASALLLEGVKGGNAHMAAACEGMARNPGASAAIRFALILGLALIESLALYTLLIIFAK